MRVMKVVKILAVVLVAIAVILGGTYAYMGGFKTISVDEKPIGPIEVVFTTHRGSYSSIGTSWEKFYEKALASGLADCDALAFYLDPPGIPEENLRSVLACRLDNLDPALQEKLRQAFPTFSLPRTNAVHSSFPFVNFFSYMLGPMKVYPEMQKMMTARNLTAFLGIEVYGIQGQSRLVEFYFPLDLDQTVFKPLADAF